MDYSLKTLDQLPLVLKGFRKQRGLTQAAMADRLGVSQQSYAWFEANPATATLERLFTVLRLLGVDVSLSDAGEAGAQARSVSETAPANRKPARVVAKARKQEAW